MAAVSVKKSIWWQFPLLEFFTSTFEYEEDLNKNISGIAHFSTVPTPSR